MNSRDRGVRGELAVRDFLRERGYAEARRGQQYSGLGDSPDVVGVPGLHIEVKNTRRLALYDAVDQSVRDCGAGSVPIVFHIFDRRRTGARGRELVILSATDFFDLWAEAKERT